MPPKPAHLFPPSNAPRTWLITAAAAPIGLRLARALLHHGDNLVLCVTAAEREKLSSWRQPGDNLGSRLQIFALFLYVEVVEKGWRERTRLVTSDGRAGECQAAVATAVHSFGALDILLCNSSEAIVGSVEELSSSEHTMTLIREQFETNFFGPINMMKASLPVMRDRKSGHIINITGITSHLGTPGLSAYCSSGWAIEGFCDSLAYEIAPFNIKQTIMQPNYEISVLTNQISAAPAMPEYMPPLHSAPLSRSTLGRLLDRIDSSRYGIYSPSTRLVNGEDAASDCETEKLEKTKHSSQEKRESWDVQDYPSSFSSTRHITTLTPDLPPQMLDALVAETVHALIAIGGHENPPTRHIVGFEGIASVKEKLKTVSEELEDFVECSTAVDINENV